jgi:hypothetical protein
MSGRKVFLKKGSLKDLGCEMLIPIEFDLACFTTDRDRKVGIHEIGLHQDLLEVLLHCGVLVYSGDSFHDSPLIQRIYQLPVELRKSWELALQNCARFRSSNRQWDGAINIENPHSHCENPTLAIVCDHTAVCETRDGQTRYSLIKNTATGDVEIIGMDFVRRSQLLTKFKVTCGALIVEGNDLNSVWNERFLWLVRAENIKNVSIVDSWALLNSPALRNIPPAEICGSQRFIKNLAREAAGEKYLKIYTSWGDQSESLSKPERKRAALDYARLLNQELEQRDNKNIKEVEIIILNQKEFRRCYHDRYVRFGDFIWDIGNGLQCFEGERQCKKRVQASFKAGKLIAKDYKDSEQVLKQSNNRTAMRVLIGNDRSVKMSES